MIEFLRRIRRNLLTENKFSKYLLYAAGEIILVVIGILIALGANNYNEQKKEERQSRVILKEMLEDLASDTTYLSKMLPVLEQQLSNEDWLLNKNTIDISDIDSIKLAVNNVNWAFDINDRSFLNIQNSDAAKLTGYEHLYGDISKYYIITKAKIKNNNQIEMQTNNSQSTFDQVINQNILITTKQYIDYTGFKMGLDLKKPTTVGDFEKIKATLSQIQTKNALYEKYSRHNYLYLALYFCDQEAKKLIEIINNLLRKHNKN